MLLAVLYSHVVIACSLPQQWAVSGRPWLHPGAESALRSPLHTVNTKDNTGLAVAILHLTYLNIHVCIWGFFLFIYLLRLSYELRLLLQVDDLREEVCDLLLLSGSILALPGQVFCQRGNLQVGSSWEDRRGKHFIATVILMMDEIKGKKEKERRYKTHVVLWHSRWQAAALSPRTRSFQSPNDSPVRTNG